MDRGLSYTLHILIQNLSPNGTNVKMTFVLTSLIYYNNIHDMIDMILNIVDSPTIQTKYLSCVLESMQSGEGAGTNSQLWITMTSFCIGELLPPLEVK